MTIENQEKLYQSLNELAQVPNLLIACDFDGTLAPIVSNPMEAKPLPDTSKALRSLAELSNTSVAIVSGRSLRDLATLSRLPEEIRLVGSHGSEFEIGFSENLTENQSDLRDKLMQQIKTISSVYQLRLEYKPAGVAVHLRNLDDETKIQVLKALEEGPNQLENLQIINGKEVVEYSVLNRNKGHALDRLRTQVGANAVIYIGDDTTDEQAFKTLKGPDVGIKVGDGETKAKFRISSPDEVAKVLAFLNENRTEWLQGAALVPLQDHSIISDLRTAAIITPEARITWMCAPRIDSSSIFAELVGGPNAGHFTISDPTGPVQNQYYEPNSLLLKTEFPNFTVTDMMDTSMGRTRRLAGRTDLIRKIEGSGEVTIEFAPRLNFNRSYTTLQIKDDGLIIEGTNDLISLRSPGVEWNIITNGNQETGIGKVNLKSGEPVYLELRTGNASLKPSTLNIEERIEETSAYWLRWAERIQLPELKKDLVLRSAIILKSLCHKPTGAILAAATTSLPETLGGVRNWDYRYCWLRDAALTAATLVRLGTTKEAMSYLDWVLKLLENRDDPERLSPLYNVAGRHLQPEAELTDMPGYGGSRPVRIGNAADEQVQLDVFGPIVNLVYLVSESGEPLSAEHWELVKKMVLAVTRRWKEPDHGIWEVRKPPRHHVYTKTMCWVTVDKAIKVAENFVEEAPSEWKELRDEIASEVLTEGWNEEKGCFTNAYTGTDLDASVMAIGLYGLIEPQDPRFIATVDNIVNELKEGDTVYRYIEDDGLPGKEGGFNIMTSWLINSLWLIGRKEEARDLFEKLCQQCGSTGIMAEQLDPINNRALGNLPQAYSHLGLIDNAVLMSKDEH